MNQFASRKPAISRPLAALCLSALTGPAMAGDELRIPTFEAPATLASVSTSGNAVPALADLDGDKDLDLILGTSDGTLQFFENTGDILSANFVEVAEASVDAIDVGDRSAPHLADFDHDGDMDLVVGAADGTLHYFRNDGSAFAMNFVAQSGADNPFDGLGVGSNAVPSVGDIDYDNLPDVLVGAGDGTVTVLANSGTVIAPAFAEATEAGTLLLGIDFGNDAAPMLGDVDGDTDIDLVIGNADGTFAFYMNGRGGYQGDSYEEVAFVDTGWTRLSGEADSLADFDIGSSAAGSFADLDGDGDTDLIVGASNGNVLFSMSRQIKKLVGVLDNYSGLAHPPDRFGIVYASPEYAFWEVPNEPQLNGINYTKDMWHSRTSGDLDGDGLLDFVTLESSHGYVRTLSGYWSSEEFVATGTSISWRRADAWNYWGDNVNKKTEWIYLDYPKPTGGVSYGPSKEEFVHGHPVLVDFDWDGDLDLVIGGSGDEVNGKTNERLGYFENTGDASWPVFERRENEANPLDDIVTTAGRNSFAPALVDLDGDGDLDCILGQSRTTREEGNLIYWENTGTPDSPSFVDRGEGPFSNLAWDHQYMVQPHFADFDRDGDLDMVVYSTDHLFDGRPDSVNWDFSSKYFFYENTGNARNPNYELRGRHAPWDAQTAANNPFSRVYVDAEAAWPGYDPKFHLGIDGLDRLMIADMNYDGLPDLHYMQQQLPQSGFYRTKPESIAPTASLRALGTQPYYSSEVLQIQVSFDEEVDRIDVGDFKLTQGLVNVDLDSATLSGSGTTYILDLSSVDLSEGDYTLTLMAAGSSIHDAFGNELENDAARDFSVVEIDHDVSIDIDGPTNAEHGEGVIFTVTARNGSSFDSAGNAVLLSFSRWLTNLQVIKVVTTGGATSTNPDGSQNASTLTSSVDLPSGSSVVYTISGAFDLSNTTDAPGDKINSVTARITPPAIFGDEAAENNHAGCHTLLEPLATSGGALHDQGVQLTPATELHDVLLGDLNGDGAPDAVVASGSTYSVIFNDGSGGFSGPLLDIGSSFVITLDAALGDMDGDGDLDIVMASPGIIFSSKTRIAFNDGAGNFTAGPQLSGSLSVEIGDADNDGDLDLFFDSSVRLNAGDGTFPTFIPLDSSHVHATADLNGDGELDVITDNGIHFGDGRQGYPLAQALSIPLLRRTALGDLDRDGDLDLIVAGPTNRIYLNDGLGAFTESSVELSEDPASDLAVGDFNADGLLDILLMINGTLDSNSYLDGTNLLYLNNGSATFSDPVAVGDQGTHLAIADVTGDGAPDAVMISEDALTNEAFRVWAPEGVPTITLAGDLQVVLECGDPFLVPGAGASDAEDGNLTDSIIIDSSSLDESDAGDLEIIYSVTDSDGNTTRVIRSVMIFDIAPPVITLIGDNPQTVPLGTAYAELGATAVDSCDKNIGQITIDARAVDPNTLGTYLVTYDVSDHQGNAASTVTRTVIVADITPPAITILGDPLVFHEAGTPYPTDHGAIAWDNLDGDLTSAIVTTQVAPLNQYLRNGDGDWQINLVGTYAINYEVTDAQGNHSIATRTIEMTDTTGPVIRLNGDAAVTVNQGSVYIDEGAWTFDLAEGRVDERLVVDNPVDTNTPGIYTVSYTATDSLGNAAGPITRTVEVLDTVAPVISLNGDSEIGLYLNEAYLETGATASDPGAPNPAVQIGGDTVDSTQAGIYIVTYDATDDAGNAAQRVTRKVVVGILPRLHVNASAPDGGDGSTWNLALNKLQDALGRTFAGKDQEVWVAAGVYHPDEGVDVINDDRNECFVLKDSVQIYGGFSGSETNLDQRTLNNEATVLSGDIDGNDDSTGSDGIIRSASDNIGSNAYTVVHIESGATEVILDRITLTGGRADNTIDFVFPATDETGRGGALYSEGATFTIRDCQFVGNLARDMGGACFFSQCDFSILRSRIIANRCSGFGGGIVVEGSSGAIEDCQLLGNSANFTGAFGSRGDSDVDFLNCQIAGNDGSSAAGAIYVQDASLSFVNCVLSGNKGANQAIVYIDGLPTLEFINCTLTGNSGASLIGPGALVPVENLIFINCIVWNNSGPLHSVRPTDVTVNATNLLANEDPRFISPITSLDAPTSEGDFRLAYGSPYVDAGASGYNDSIVDFAGAARLNGAAIDRGAYEGEIDNRPIVTLEGNATVMLSLGTAWTDPGATALDFSGNILPVVVGGDTVDPGAIGEYVITYDATDDDGLTSAQATRVVRILSHFDIWIQSYFPGETDVNIIGHDANPGSDGISNLLKFAFGLNPTINDSGMLAVTDAATFTPGQPIGHLSYNPFNFSARFVRLKEHLTLGVTYTVEFSSDLSVWVASTTNPTVISDDGSDYQVVEVPRPFFVNGGKAKYFRVVVTMSP